MIVDDGEVLSARAMSAAGTVKASFTYGLSEIAELSLELDGSSQWGAVTSTAWDPTNVAQAAPATGDPLRIAAGNLDVNALAARLGGDSYTLLMPASLAANELKAWADAAAPAAASRCCADAWWSLVMLACGPSIASS